MTTNKFDLNQEFDSDRVLTASEPDLLIMLKQICSEPVHNDLVRHREIVRGLTINHILMKRHIDTLNNQNATTQRWVMVLALIATVGTLAQVYLSLWPLTKIAQPSSPQSMTKIICPSCSNYSSSKSPIKEQVVLPPKSSSQPRHSSSRKETRYNKADAPALKPCR